MCDGIVSNQELLDRWRQIIVSLEQFSLFTSQCEIIVIDYTCVSWIRTSVSKTSEFDGNLASKFVSFCHLGFKSSAQKLPEERESEKPQNSDEVNTVEVGDTSNSPAKVMSLLQNVPVSSEVVMSGELQKDHELTIAEKDCVITSSEEDMDNLNAFVNDKLQFLTEKGLEQLIEDESVKVEEILSANEGTASGHIVGYEETVGAEVDQVRTKSLCPGLTPNANVEGSSCEVSFDERDEVDRILWEKLGGSCVTSAPVKGLWPIYSKRRSSVLGGHEAPPCISIRFGVSDTISGVENGNLSRSCVTEVSGGVERSDFTSGGFSTLEAIAKKRADERDGGLFEFSSATTSTCSKASD